MIIIPLRLHKKKAFLPVVQDNVDTDTDGFLIMTCSVFLDKLNYPSYVHSFVFFPYSVNVLDE